MPGTESHFDQENPGLLLALRSGQMINDNLGLQSAPPRRQHCISLVGCDPWCLLSTLQLFVPSVLWYCWLGLLTCKNRLPYNLYCVGVDVKHCIIQSNSTLQQLNSANSTEYCTLFALRYIHASCSVYSGPSCLSCQTLFTFCYVISLPDNII